jgi:hypothetical protein
LLTPQRGLIAIRKEGVINLRIAAALESNSASEKTTSEHLRRNKVSVLTSPLSLCFSREPVDGGLLCG